MFYRATCQLKMNQSSIRKCMKAIQNRLSAVGENLFRLKIELADSYLNVHYNVLKCLKRDLIQ